ncbi:Galactose oxidase/kelch repeat superfamily protein [Gossypium australe]|uniref:Galactose oxidase/kelch repeat superfamily protein n=1 Tax=Gossypium australe TaxID=47621 RepID=A0A5B6USP2_9ROSI|nr:Galactose oxidase/kelch repeat superfamily protein [Gossypium australe]
MKAKSRKQFLPTDYAIKLDEMGVVRLINIEDARQHALMVEKHVWCYDVTKLITGKIDDATEKGPGVVQGVKIEQTTLKNTREASFMNRNGGANMENLERGEREVFNEIWSYPKLAVALTFVVLLVAKKSTVSCPE